MFAQNPGTTGDVLPSPPAVLTIAASDPSCGAGIQADILTLASMGCHPLSVISAVTVQDSVGVEGVKAIDADWVADQARCILEDIPVAAFKIGVLGSVENITAIADIIADYPNIPLVLDPVLASGRGDEFADEYLIEAIREFLIPHCTLVTPNALELHRLVSVSEPDEAASEVSLVAHLLHLGCEYVLVTGTHAPTLEVINSLYHATGLIRSDNWLRLPRSYHGSGCTLATAVAAVLAHGAEMKDAVYEAQEFTWQTLKSAYRPGMGQHIPDRLFWARERVQDDKSAS